MTKKKRLTLEERENLQRYLEKYPYLSFAEICRFLGRSNNTIDYEVKQNGGRKNYCAKKAHEKALMLKGGRSKQKCRTLNQMKKIDDKDYNLIFSRHEKLDSDDKKKLKRLTFEERENLQFYLEKCPNKSIREISKSLNRPESTIYTEINRMGKRNDYNAVRAQKRYETLNSVKTETLRPDEDIEQINNEKVINEEEDIFKINIKDFLSLPKRMLNLEMQLEILYDTIKDFLNE